jgi:type II secretory pathway predicted ATPase ExeA
LHEQTGRSLLRLKQEFRVLAELTHPNLVRFGGLFEEHGQFYFTMELVDGQEFLDFVRPAPTIGGGVDPGAENGRQSGRRPVGLGGELAIPRGRSWHGRHGHPGVLDTARLQHGITQLASGLMALHAAGLVHRDVKPQNVLVTRTGRVVLLDFGLAVSINEGNAKDLAGTMAYMAPEQALGQDVQGSADWYSVGVLLHEALTGQLPASHQRFRNFWIEAKAKAPSAAAAVTDVAGDLTALSARLLEFAPEQRPDESAIARSLGLEVDVERGRAGFRSQAQYKGGTFVARETELAVLRAALLRARSGGFPVVRVTGESGIGKSKLMRQLTTELRNEGEVVVLASRCYDNETMNYRGVDGVIDALVGHLQTSMGDGEPFPACEYIDYLAEVFPVFRALPGLEELSRPPRFDSDPQDARQKAFKAFKQVFRLAAAEQPIVMCVDDAQWMDADSIALLASLLRDRSARAMLVICQRPTRDERLTALFEAAGACEEIGLGPLNEQHSEELVRLMLEGSSVRADIDPSALARTSCGHPLFIQELVLHARRTRRQVATLDEVIHLRLRALNDAARELLELVAVAAGPLRNVVARAASGSSSDLFPWILSELRSQNLVSFNSDSMSDHVQIYHDRFRELIIQTMNAEAQRRAHERLARAFEAHAPDELEELAHHSAGAGNLESAAGYAARAGWRALETLTFEHAAAQFFFALRFEVRADVRTKIEVSLGDALAGSGRGVDAAAAYLRAADGKSRQAALELRRRASEQLLGAGHVERGSELLFSVLREAGEFVPRNDLSAILWLVRALVEMSRRGLVIKARAEPLSERESLALRACWTAATGLSMVHHLRATAFQGRALLLALDAGDLDRVVRSAALLSATLSNADGAVRRIGERLRARARELAEQSASDESRAWIDLTCGVAAMGEWDFRTCELSCSNATTAFRARCAAWETATSRAFMLWSAAFRGDFHGVLLSLPELLAEARARGDRHAETALILSPLHLVGLAADEPERVRAQCAQSMAEWPSKLACFQHMCGSYVLAQTDLYQARSSSAWKHVTDAWKMLHSAHLARVQFQRIDLLSLRARAALARTCDARGVERMRWSRRVRSDLRWLRRERSPAAAAFADMIQGAHEHLRGNDMSSLECLRAAAFGFDLLAMRLHANVCRLAAATVGGDAESRAAAERTLRELGVANPPAMLRLWVPGVSNAAA